LDSVWRAAILEALMSARKNAPAGAYPRRARPNPLADCPLNAAFAAVGGKWKLTIIYWLAHGEHHFSGLQRRAAPISHKVLTEQLRQLEADRIVERVATGTVPAPVHYHLSEYGRTLLPLVESVRLWGEQHLRRTRDATAGSPMHCTGSLLPAPDMGGGL
jgi:DNA-binding HxlR family transcriptional regulator